MPDGIQVRGQVSRPWDSPFRSWRAGNRMAQYQCGNPLPTEALVGAALAANRFGVTARRRHNREQACVDTCTPTWRVLYSRTGMITTGVGSRDSGARSYRFGYGVIDANLNHLQRGSEQRVYIEINDFSTSHVFYENYKD